MTRPSYPLFFDIETAANPAALVYMPEPTAPANYKDVEKINQYVTDRKAEQLSQAALDADYGQIVAISLSAEGGDVLTRLIGDPETPTEADLLNWFWKYFKRANGRCCGYNIIGFDLPYLLRRSFDLDIGVMHYPALAKYRTEPVTDLMGILYNWGPAKGLKWVCKRYGIHNPLPDLDGSQVASMDADTLRAYSANDVHLVRALYNRMEGVYFGMMGGYYDN